MTTVRMTPETYPHVAKPFDHQRKYLAETWDHEVHGILWEQGTGKTKFCIDTACLQYANDMIEAVLVVAPSGVHLNWQNTELPEHMPDMFKRATRSFSYSTDNIGTKYRQRQLADFMEYKGFAWLIMSYDNFMTDAGKKVAKKFLTSRRVLFVLDESSNIKNPASKRTKTMMSACTYAKYRRVMEGTPVADSPFDAYSQIRFLDKSFWRRFDCEDYASFKTKFGIWVNAKRSDGKTFPMLKAYKNLELLNEALMSISSRVLKDEAMDLPPKLYTKRYFQLGKEQRRVYDELRQGFQARLGKMTKCPECDGKGEVWSEVALENCPGCGGYGQISESAITTEMVLVQRLRMQQVSCGYVPTDDPDAPLFLLTPNKANPRIQLLEEIVENTPGKLIIWARFTEDIDQIMNMALRKKWHAVRYDGKVSEAERDANKVAFQKEPLSAGGPKLFVSKPQSGGTGLTLHAAKTVVYYNNSFKLRERQQSEDRAHRGGMDEHPVLYIDIIAEDTQDQYIVDTLRGKYEIATLVQGDPQKEWI